MTALEHMGMREILFRGKRCDNGEWVEAFSVMRNMVYEDWVYYIGASNTATMELDKHLNLYSARSLDDFLFYSVHPETVGQFTGRVDKNGKKIFEGDIVRCVYEGKEMVGHVIYNDCCFNVKKSKSPNQPAMDLCDDFEVIGNINDNPELLEE